MDKLSICFDLGSDSLKVSYGYLDEKGVIQFGKVVEESYIPQSAIPSITYYDEIKDEWIFGKEINKYSTFSNIVKIKDLLSLLNRTGNEEVDKQNNYYYYYGHDFPKFYFPARVKLNNQNDFAERAKNDYTFKCNKKTPHNVCQEYFKFVAELTKRRILSISKVAHIPSWVGYDVTVIYPSNASAKYIEEQKTLIETAFTVEIKNSISSTRALAMYAMYQKKVTKGDSFLVFDIGDETISVTKASINEKNNVMIDGVDGHSLPKRVGGADIDEAIGAYVDKILMTKETLGTPSYGESGHIQEKGLISKQYLLRKNIKDAKKYIINADEINIDVYRDVNVQVPMTVKNLQQVIGVTNSDGVAKQLLDYALNEVNNQINAEVKKIFFSGGVVETSGLFKYFKQKFLEARPDIQVYNFAIEGNLENDYTIADNENSLYSPSMGGNYVTIKGLNINMCISMSYGTYGRVNDNNVKANKANAKYLKEKYFIPFVDKGTVIEGNQKIFRKKMAINKTTDEEFFSTPLYVKDITPTKVSGSFVAFNNKEYYVIFDEGKGREEACERISLRRVTGGSLAKIKLWFNGREVKKLSDNIIIFEGFAIDKNGHAMPYISNSNENDEALVTVTYGDDTTEGGINKNDIVVKFDNLRDFMAS